jgi:hypothetical protein
MYAMWRLLILLCPLSMLLDKSIKASFEFPEPLTQELGPGRVEPPEDVGKGGDLWHGCAGADDNIARAQLQLESTFCAAGNKVHRRSFVSLAELNCSESSLFSIKEYFCTLTLHQAELQGIFLT